MSFFSQFPTIKYDVRNDNVKNDIIDIFRHVDAKDSRIDEITTYMYYEVVEGERPDVVSNRLYGTPDYHWTFFIINEGLKKGLLNWPSSYRRTELRLEQEFGKHSILTFIPRQYPVARKYENSFEMANYFGGLELDSGNIILKAHDPSINAQAKITKFDDQRFQLWIYDLENTRHFRDYSMSNGVPPVAVPKDEVRDWSLVYIDNPYTSGPKYTEFEDKRDAWAAKALEWLQLNYTSVYFEFLNDTRNKAGLIAGTTKYYKYFLTTYFSKVTFTSQRFYEEAQHAPSYFLDNEFEDENSTAFDAYKHVYNDNDINLPYSYFRGETDPDVGATRIDGFDQSSLEVYGDISRNRRYVPSFIEVYYADQAKYVSYLEHLKTAEFDNRRIRVIRPELIDQFVEIYQEKLLK
jgi:hypothetical protein